MNKVGIVTIYDITNYGNRLQCYAIQKYIKSIGFCPEHIKTIFEKKDRVGILSKLKRKLKVFLNYNDEREKNRNRRIKEENFAYFENYIKYSKEDIVNGDGSLINHNDFLYFVVGSDQVWNCDFFDNLDPYMLTFSVDTKKISYAASFGIDKISLDKISYYKCMLSKFKEISVREEAGARIIKELTGQDVPVLIDPTLLLDIDEWRKVSKKPKEVRGGYVLTYFLSSKCDEAKKELDKIICDREMYELMDLTDKVAGSAGPSEFIWLFDHADIILTDSFHACIFAFLFNKPFLVFDRKWSRGNMNSRLETFLSKFSLERKYYGSGLENDIWEHNYEVGYKQLGIERERAFAYFRNAFNQ